MAIEAMYDNLIEEICKNQNPNCDYRDTCEYGQYIGFNDGFFTGFELALKAIQNQWEDGGRCMVHDIYDQISKNKDKYLK